MTKTEKIINLNQQAEAIYKAHPDDYHRREDFQDIVIRRSAIINEPEQEQTK
jgi:hypothetical protein